MQGLPKTHVSLDEAEHFLHTIEIPASLAAPMVFRFIPECRVCYTAGTDFAVGAVCSNPTARPRMRCREFLPGSFVPKRAVAMLKFVLAIFISSAMLQSATETAAPGMLNSFTGEVWMNGALVGGVSAGRSVLETGHSIKTGEGMAELLLSPGTFVRLANRSELTLNEAGPSNVRITLGNGEALIEVLDSQTPVFLEQNGITAVIRNPGLYDFNKERGVMAVFAGEARFSKGDKQIIASKGFGVTSRGFHELQTSRRQDSPIFAWSKLRSEILSSESAALAEASPGGTSNLRGPGWYWNPWSSSYTYLSASGAVTGPFGWPYYSPGYVPNYAPAHRGGDSWLYGPPVLSKPGSQQTQGPGNSPQRGAAPTVPLTAPGVPQFPNNRF